MANKVPGGFFGNQRDGEKQRMFELSAGETWTPFLEEINDLMIEEKVARHENDHIKVSEICLRIVRLYIYLYIIYFYLFWLTILFLTYNPL